MADNTINTKINFSTNGLNKIEQLHKQLDTKKMSGSMRQQLDSLTKQSQDAIKEAQSRFQKGDYDISDLGLDKLDEQLEKLQRRIAGSIKGGLVRSNDDITELHNNVKELEKELRKLEKSREQAHEKATHASLQAEQIGRDAGFEGKEIAPMQEALEQKKRQMSQATSKKKKQQYQEEIDSINKTIKAIEEKEQQVDKYSQQAREIIKKEKEKTAELNKQNEIKQQEIQKGMKDLDDPRLNLLNETSAITKKTSAMAREKQQEKALADAKERSKDSQDNLTKAKDKGEESMAKKITTGLKYYVVLNQLRRIYRSLVRTISDFDRAMTTVAMVSSMNREQVWDLAGAYQELGDQVGMAATEVANLSIYFFRQGRSASDALEMTRVAAESARVAAIDATESANYLTSAINGFQLAASDAEQVADRFAALGAASASSYDELARAMSKVAPSAQSAGVDIDHMMGFLAKGIETTREAPQNIGTAFKTVFARMQELTDFGATLEDGVSVNRIEEALSEVNVQLRDSMGIFRPAQDVINDLGMVWDDLNRNMQAYLAVAFAGIRQQPRFLALMNNYGRTMELVEESQSAAGEMAIQHAAYIEGLEGSVNRLSNAWEKFLNAISDSEGIIAIVDGLRSVLGGITTAIEAYGDGLVVMATVGGAALAVLMLSKIKFVALTAQSIKTGTRELALQAAGIKLVKNKVALRRIENASLTKAIQLTLQHNAALLKTNHIYKKQAAAAGMATTSKITWKTVTDLLTGSVTKLRLAILGLMSTTVVLAVIAAAFWAISKAVEFIIKGGRKLFNWFKSLFDGAEEAASAVRDLERDLHNLNKEQGQLEDTVDRFRELRDQAELTTEEVREMNDLLHDLSDIDVMGEEMDFTMTTASGRTVFNDEKYERVLKEYEEEQKRIREEQAETFRKSLEDDLEGTLQQDDLIQIQRRLMFEAQEIRIDNLEKDVRDSIERTFDDMLLDFEMPINIIPQIETRIQRSRGGMSHSYDRIIENEEEMKNFFKQNHEDLVATMREQGVEVADTVEENTDIFLKALQNRMIEEVHLIEAMESQLSDHFFNLAKIREKTLDENIDPEDEGSEVIAVKKSLDAIQKYIEEVEKEAPLLAEYLENIIQENFVEEMGIKTLTETFELDIDTVVRWRSSQANVNEIADLIESTMEEINVQDMFSESMSLNPSAAAEALKASESLFLELFDDIDMSSAEGVEDFYERILPQMRRMGIETENLVRNVSDVFAPDLEDVSRSIDQVSDRQIELYQQQAEYQEKGYLSAEDTLEIAREYGQEGLDAVKNNKDLSFLFDQQLEQERNKLEIAAKEKRMRIENGEVSQENLAYVQNELAALEKTLENWKEMHAFDEKRIASLQTIERHTSRIGEIHSRLSSLADMGMEDTGLFSLLDDQAARKFESTSENVMSIIEEDFKKISEIEEELANLGAEKRDGVWLKGESEAIDNLIDDLDDLLEVAGESMDEYIALHDERVGYIEDYYSREKDAVEDRYQEELDLIDKVHSKRWEEIDFQNNLAESNEQILDIRRRMSALSREGSRSAMLQRREAEKELREQQQERQRQIEDEIVQREQQRLEEAREEELKELGDKQVEATNELTEAIRDLIERLADGDFETDDPDDIIRPNTQTQTPGRAKQSSRSENINPGVSWAFQE